MTAPKPNFAPLLLACLAVAGCESKDTTDPTPSAGDTESSGATTSDDIGPDTNPEPAEPNGSPESGPTPPLDAAGMGGSSPLPQPDTTEAAGMAAVGGGAMEVPAGDVCESALLCDGFEDDASGMPLGQPWQTDVNGGEVQVSNERAFSGTNSVHVSNTEGAYKRAFFSLQADPVFPAAGQEMYGRMMMWLEATPTGSVHWTFIQAEGPSKDGSYDIFYRYGGQHQGRLMANFETQGASTDCWDHSETVMPTQTWSCLEWRFSTATDELQFWLDGAELTDIHVTGAGEGCVAHDLDDRWPAPAEFEVLRLGWEKYQESGELHAWIDDVVVSSNRVGCPGVR